ncbi:hypothetical protein HY990_00315 [Candidatus Micrarchaeota archaeon]|nr:hypothetical protein [Candidatus Micrarchaeota archaeon]
MAPEIDSLLNQLKSKGIESALVRVDGVLVQTTMALNDSSVSLLTGLFTSSDALCKRLGDSQKQIQLSLGDSLLIIVPLKNHFLCGLIKNPEDRKYVVEMADSLKAYL